MAEKHSDNHTPHAADPKLQDDAKLGSPKSAHRDVVNSGKHENKDTRREVREIKPK